MSEKKEYIERGALLKAFGCENAVKYGNKNAEQQHKSYSSMMLYEIADEIYDAPAADVEPVVRGEWKDRCVRDWACSLCGCEIQKVRFYDGYRYTSLPDFCPDCGAVMTEAGLKKIAERSGSGE